MHSEKVAVKGCFLIKAIVPNRMQKEPSLAVKLLQQVRQESVVPASGLNRSTESLAARYGISGPLRQRNSRKEITMASPALRLTDVEPLRTSQAPSACSLSDLATLVHEREEAAFARESTISREADGLYLSPANGLKGAKGAMMAIGLEAAAAFVFYGIWQAWHALR